MRRWLVVLWLFLMFSSAWAGETVHLTILHTNDLHGMMLPFKYSGHATYAGKNAGGLARRAYLISQIRKSAGHPVVVVDCGDLFTRGPWEARFRGVPEIQALNYMHYDMMCVGNNELKAGKGTHSQAMMLGLVRRSKFPWLAANLTQGTTGKRAEGVKPYIVRRIEGVRVGFLGLTAFESSGYPQTRGWTISDPIQTARKWVPIARKECDVLIAVTHIGYPFDLMLASSVSGIDAIVGGHTHTFTPSFRMIAASGKRIIPIVQAGERGVVLGRLDLTIEKRNGWQVVKAESHLIPIDSSVPEDRVLKGLLQKWLNVPAPKPIPHNP